MDSRKNPNLIPLDESSIDLNALIPLGLRLIENHRQQTQAQGDIEKEKLRLAEEKLKLYKIHFLHKFWLLSFVTLAILGIASALIFFKADTHSGMTMLSHVGAVIVGIIAGSGWERMRGG